MNSKTVSFLFVGAAVALAAANVRADGTGGIAAGISGGKPVPMSPAIVGVAVAPVTPAAGAKAKLILTIAANPDGCSAHLAHGDGTPGQTVLFQKSVTSVEVEKTYKAPGMYTETLTGQTMQTNAGGVITNWAACLGTKSVNVQVVAGRR